MGALATRITLTLMVAMAAVSTDLYLAGIPEFVKEFGSDSTHGQLTLAVFMAGFAVGQLVYGPFSDYWGRRPLAIIGLLFYLVTCLICALANTMEVLLSGRLMQGLAAAAGPVLARAVVSDRYAGKESARIMAYLVAAMALVPCFAPVVGSWLLIWFDWRSHFFALFVVGVVTLAGLIRLPESCSSIGQVRPRAGTIARQFWTCARDPVFLAFALTGSLVFGGMFAFISSASFIMIDILDTPAENFGYNFAVVVTGYVIGAVVNSRQVGIRGVGKVLTAGVLCCLVAAGLLLLSALWSNFTVVSVIGMMWLFFFGAGMTVTNGQMGAISAFPQAAGAASSVVGFLQTIIAGLSSSLVATFYDNTLLPSAVIIAGFAALATIVAMILKRQ